MRCVAIIMVRNGIDYIDRCLTHLAQHKIEVIVLDHESNDGTYEQACTYLNQPVIQIYRLPYKGVFCLEEQLNYKKQLIDQVSADWVIHQDIDECLEPPSPYTSLLSFLEAVNCTSHNVVNFHELVFLPYQLNSEESFYESLYYYFFQPTYPRLMRAWRKHSNLSNITSGGHRLVGDVSLYPLDGVLKHYIFTSQAHALQKYPTRTFSEYEIAQGWHRNRVQIDLKKLLFPPANRLQKLSACDDRNYILTDPWTQHYWDIQ